MPTFDALASSATVATLLPGVEFSTRQPYPDARRLLDAGVTVAIATDCNPGSCFTSSMPLCVALAVREMRMTTQEAVWAATAGGARALRRPDVGHLAAGARADLVLLDAPSHAYLAYRPGVPLVTAVWRDGRLAAGRIPAGLLNHDLEDLAGNEPANLSRSLGRQSARRRRPRLPAHRDQDEGAGVAVGPSDG